jgi:hypothetical protein
MGRYPPEGSALQDHMGGDIDTAWYLSGKVARYHTTYGINQSLADHQWGVAAFILRHNPDASRNLIVAALFHDGPEFIAGDCPGPSKRFFPEHARSQANIERLAGIIMGFPTPPLTKEEGLWLKLADLYECGQLAELCTPEPFRSRIDTGKIIRACHEICEELGVQIKYPGADGPLLGGSLLAMAYKMKKEA